MYHGYTYIAAAKSPQLANQFVASIYYTHKHHDLRTVSATDTVRADKKESEGASMDQDGMSRNMIHFQLQLQC